MIRLLPLLRRKRVWIPLGLLAAYAGFGFLVLPGILRGQVVASIRRDFGREAKLAKVRVNPLLLSLTLERFELQDPDGTPFVGFDRLHVDYQLSSLVRWAITLREFRLDRPRVHVRLMRDGQPNFTDLVPKESGKPPRLVIGSFQIHDGAVKLTNLMPAEPEEGELAPLDLTLENFTTIPQKEGVYRIAARDQGNGSWEWNGELTFEPLHSAGELEIRGTRLRPLWEIARNRVGFEITDGELGCRLQYAVDVHGDSLVARLEQSSLAVTRFALREKGKAPDLLRFDSLSVTGIRASHPEQTAAVDRVLLAGTNLQAWLEPDTTLNWLALLAPPAAVPAPSPVPAARDTSIRAATPPPPWTATVGEVAVRDLAIQLEDRTLEPPFRVAVAPASVTLRNLTTTPGSAFAVAGDLKIAEQGRLEVTGTVVAEPPAADLAIRLAQLPLPIFQPYVSPRAKLQVVSGTVGVSGDVRFRGGGPQPDLRFKGRVESRDLLTRDRIANDRVLAWKAVEVNAIDFAPERVSVGSVKLTEPFAKLLIHRDRTTNVQDILGLAPVDSLAADSVGPAEAARGPETAGGKGKRAAKGRKPAKSQPRASEALAALQHSAAASAPRVPVRIGAVEVVGGSADFADLSLLLPFAARIEHLAGTVTGLSSDSAARAAVVLDGRLQPSGLAQVRGTINPLAEVVFLDLGVVFRGFNMPVLTPYTGQFLGREIDKGRMSLDLGYRLQGRHLVGENKVVLDQLQLGQKVESPEATKLPVGLAIAILKDKNGQIDLDLPVEGDLDDPKFRIGKVIWDFILSLLKKVATATFALLGRLIGGGGGDELSHVDFEAGTSRLPEDQKEPLGQLAQALGKRPELRLEVRGRSDQAEDAAAIRAAKFTALAAGELPADHLNYKAGSDKRVLNEAVLQTALRDTLTALQTADEAELLSLANERSNAVKTSLVASGIEEARVYVLDPEPGKVEKERIRIELTLTD